MYKLVKKLNKNLYEVLDVVTNQKEIYCEDDIYYIIKELKDKVDGVYKNKQGYLELLPEDTLIFSGRYFKLYYRYNVLYGVCRRNGDEFVDFKVFNKRAGLSLFLYDFNEQQSSCSGGFDSIKDGIKEVVELSNEYSDSFFINFGKCLIEGYITDETSTVSIVDL